MRLLLSSYQNHVLKIGISIFYLIFFTEAFAREYGEIKNTTEESPQQPQPYLSADSQLR